MDEYTSHTRCSECDGTHGDHYAGCSYDGREKRGGFGGSAEAKFCFFIILMFGAFVTAFVPPLGIGIIVLGAKITGV